MRRGLLPCEREIHETPVPIVERPGREEGSHARHSRESCERKVGYETERVAWLALRRMRRDGKDCTGRGTYQCRWCGMWHIGRRVS